MRKPLGKALAAAVVLAAVPLSAKANLLTNGGLVGKVTTISAYTIGNHVDKQKVKVTTTDGLPGWTVAGSVDVVRSKLWATTGTSGSSVDLIGTNGAGSITQTVSDLTIGDTYTLTFDLAANPAKWHKENQLTKYMDVTVSDSSLTDPEEFSKSVVSGETNKTMSYVTKTVTFIALSSDVTITLSAILPETLIGKVTANNIRCGAVVSNLDLELVDSNGTGGGQTQVPEPASVGLLGLGAVALLKRRNRRA